MPSYVFLGQTYGLTMSGGSGDDQFEYRAVGETIIENLYEGNDTVFAYVDCGLDRFPASELENIVAVGATRTIVGNNLSNVMIGSDLDNVIAGMGGDDTMVGGAGDDTYSVDSVGDVVSEAQGEGTSDTIFSSVSLVLPENVENLTLVGAGPSRAIGNAGSNRIEGNGAANALAGDGGADVLIGGGGADSFFLNDIDGVDAFLDFTPADDTLVLNSAVFNFSPGTVLQTLAGPPGMTFFTKPGAQPDTSPHLFSVEVAGAAGFPVALYYDPDGYGGADALQFATFFGGPGYAPGAADILVT
jgi:Ca2+-binding RTX toxin-like protein